MFKKPYINNQIRAAQVRLIDELDHQVGVVTLKEALQMALDKHLDLVQVTDNVGQQAQHTTGPLELGDRPPAFIEHGH